jgi:hypothetical protein
MDGISTQANQETQADGGMMSRIRALLSQGDAKEPDSDADEPAEGAEGADASASDAPAADAASAGDAPPATDPPAAEKPATETPLTASERARTARLAVEAERTQAENVKLKAQVADLLKIKEVIDRAEKDPAAAFDLLKLAKRDFDELGDLILKDKVKRPDSETPEQRKQRELDERLEKIEQREQELESKRIYAEEIGIITEKIPADSPLKGLAWAPNRVRELFYEEHAKNPHAKVTVESAVEKLEKMVEADLRASISPKLITALLSDPAIKQRFAEALGVSAEAPGKPSKENKGAASKGGPSVLSRQAASEVPSRKPDAPPTQEELRKRAVDALISKLE